MTTTTSDVMGPLGEIETHTEKVSDLLAGGPLSEWKMDQIAEHLREVSEYAKLALAAAEAMAEEVTDEEEEEADE